MNAYELADKLDRYGEVSSLNKVWQAARMLRQQADQIAELERTLSIMEGEYPEPTVFAKITEFNSLEEAYNRIAELEKLVSEMKYEKSSGVYDLSSKPVAWINRFMDDGWLSWDKDTTADVATPLYTHPVKQLLTDDEIAQIESRCKHPLASWAWQLEFARAIIKEITE